ncbi:MAG TPA: sugar ABC transporter permease [Microbacteriaceae bacterium]|nr:sugar ABC transporter permease [Microbacteriaceae bacterium]HQX34761.1 sugar ABC transporter permease [Microbacteriaceae bacterium]HQZ48130.1 sugar ABC transporter permease [Microbacteriaceae bacterium]HRA08211.1 sugar ABC transporter permease [Microbacteriaceae bacterium]
MTDVVNAKTELTPGEGAKAPSPGKARLRRGAIIASFLLPALIVLGALVVYPIVFTIVRSFYDQGGENFAGWDNYVTMFTNDTTFTAIRNNIMWVIIAPASCTILGLIFAVLLEKLKWKTAFKLIIFMPMAISMLAAGVIFRGMFQENPNLGVVNAFIVGVNNIFSDSADYPGAKPRDGFGIIEDRGVIATEGTVSPGTTHDFPLTGIRATNLPAEAEQAVAAPTASDTQVTGTVFLDVLRGGGGVNGEIEPGKSGLPGVRVDAVAPDGSIHGFATTGAGGTFVIDGLTVGETYTIALPASNFDEGFQGVSWLSASFINGVVILSYIWIWAGFAMVMIASGLSAMDRSLQEASRIDGANEWQVFTKITAPLLSPVLIVVFVTLIINVLKIFDLVYVIPPGSSKPAANVIAVEMWTVSFGGGANQGLGSALAILLLILVLPSMIINVRRFREERGR